jgi:hypothetical protein
MADVLKSLPLFSWRGITVPLTSCKGSFEQDDVVHKFEFRDKELIESQGVKNWRFTYTIPFREDIIKGPYKQLFSNVFADFVLACRDRTPGQLHDPVLGSFRAKVANFSHEVDVHKRDGTDVSVDFIEAPEIGEIDDFIAVHDVTDKADARTIDEQVKLVDWKQETPPDPTVDILDAINGFGRQIEASGDRYRAAIDGFRFRVENIEETLDRLEDPTTWPLRLSVRQARYNAVVQLLTNQTDGSRNRITHRITGGGPIAAVAQSVKMNVQAFIALNQQLSGHPLVPAGTDIRFIQAA